MKENIKFINYNRPDENIRSYYKNWGFYNWCIHGQFVDENSNTSVMLSDTPSGCGPIQIFKYQFPNGIDNLIELMKEIFEMAYRRKHFARVPTSFMFVQGHWGYGEEIIKKFKYELGFEVRTYNNIAHGRNSDDIQSFLYLDFMTYIKNNFEGKGK